MRYGRASLHQKAVDVTRLAETKGSGIRVVPEDIAWLAQFKLSEDEAKALIVVREAVALNNSTYGELLNGLPGELAAIVGAIGQRYPPEEVRALVIALCQFRAWRTEELSDLLRRRPETIRQHYLRPLMREGHLTMTHPQELNDPQQA